MNDNTTSLGLAMKPDEALRLLGPAISRGTFYAAIKAGRVPHVRLGKRILIPRARFLAWLNGEQPEPRKA